MCKYNKVLHLCAVDIGHIASLSDIADVNQWWLLINHAKVQALMTNKSELNSFVTKLEWTYTYDLSFVATACMGRGF